MCNDGVHLFPVELDEVTCLSFDVSAAHKLHIFAQLPLASIRARYVFPLRSDN